MKKKEPQVLMSDQQLLKLQKTEEIPQEGGHFVTGFVVGALAGVLGYFVFGTKKGRRKLSEFQKEWEKYEPQMAEKVKEIKFDSILEQIQKVVKYLEMKGK